MAVIQKTKMVDKLTLGKRLVSRLKKRYQSSVPKQDRPVLETLLFAICLENASVEHAQEGYDRLFVAFHDLNEIRVSSITELAHVLDGLSDADWRAHRIRNVLQFVFEKHFEFAFEGLKRNTLELAAKQLAKIRDLSPFVHNYVLQSALGIHVVPLDRLMTNACVWLGLVPRGESPAQAAETLKPVVRKADVPVFCSLLRSLAVDPVLVKWFEPPKNASQDTHNAQTMVERLETLFKDADAAARKARKKPLPARGSPRASDGRDRTAGKGSRGRNSRSVSTGRKKK